jgi:hypothetical protein
VPEVIFALGFGECIERFSNLLLQAIDGALCSASDQGFEFREGVLDRVDQTLAQIP